MPVAPELSVFFTSMMPFIEFKLAIPFGLQLGLPRTTTFILSVAGSLLPATMLLATINPISEFLRKKSKNIDKFLSKLFKKTRRNHSQKFDRYGPLFLILFVAIPLPGSGTITAAIIAFLFAIEFWKSVSFIAAGAAVAGIFVLAGVESLTALFHFLAG